MKKRVLIRGPLLTMSGYGVHARQIAKWLMHKEDLELHVQALPWGDTPWIIDRNFDNGIIGNLMDKTIDPTGNFYDASIQIQLPNEWNTSLAKFNVGITAGVETDKCNPAWIENCNAMDAVIVPSKHTESCFRNTGAITASKGLHVIPEAYSEAISKNEKTSVDDISFSTSFNFLLFGQLTGNNPENDRKNIYYTIKWFCEAFENDPNVGLVIKTNMGRNTKIDRRLVSQMLSSLLKEVRKGSFPKIHLLHGELNDAEVASLYRHNQIKALISLTRGEGYGLPILESAASGLPVIATNWSGHLDFMNLGKFIDINYKLSQIHSSRVDNNIFIKDSNWAQPLEEDFKKKVLKFKNSNTIPKEWAEDLQKKILEKYSLDAISKMYDDTLGQFLK